MAESEMIAQIRALYPIFTKTEKRVADFVLENPKQVLFLSINDLADACQVGDSSVFRFCKTLRLQGYQEFKMRLSLGMNDAERPDLPMDEAGEEASACSSVEALSDRILRANMDALQETRRLLVPELLDQAVEAFIQAREICFFGAGFSMLMAREAACRFMRITSKSKSASDSHMQAMMASLMSPQDVAVVISYSGSTKDAIHCAKLAREAGAKVIAITRFSRSPLASVSDLTLLCGAQEGPLQGGSSSVRVSQLYLTELLYTAYFLREEESSGNKKRTSGAVVDKLV